MSVVVMYCACGYPAGNATDLDDHIVYMTAIVGDDETHTERWP